MTEKNMVCNVISVFQVISQSPAAGLATFCEPRLMSQVGRVRVDQCVSAVGVLEVPVFLQSLSYSNDMSVASITVGCHQATLGIVDDMSRLSYVEGASGWAEVDSYTW